MGAKAVDPAVVQHQDAVRVLHAGDPLGNDNLGGAGDAAGEGLADFAVRGGVHGAGGVVQDEHLRPLQQGPGDAQPLLLPAGDVGAALLDPGVVALWKAVDELVRAGGLAGGLALLQGGVLLAPAQVVQDGAGEQHVLLKHHGHLVAQRLHVVPAHVHAAHLYSAGVHIVQPADEVGEGGLAAACAADDADGLPAADVQVHVLEHLVAGAVLVGEADVVKVDGAVLHLGDRPLGVRQVGLLM